MARYANCYAADAILSVPVASTPIVSRDAIRAYEANLSKAIPRATLQLFWSAGEGNTCAVEWEYAGKNTGPLAMPDGVHAATNRELRLRGVSFLRFRSDGLIAEEHRYYDSHSMFR